MRLNKLLAHLGVASRRKADDLIREGRVTLDGKIVDQMGLDVSIGKYEIAVDGVPVEGQKVATKKKAYFLFHKPAKMISTMQDPEGRLCVGDVARDLGEAIKPAGRLDYDAEGLMVLTNDGDLAQALMHPSSRKMKTYRVKVKGLTSDASLGRLRKGVKLKDGMAQASAVKISKRLAANTWVDISVSEGRNHLIKRMFEAIDHPVIRLIRTRIDTIRLGDLKCGEIRKLNRQEVHELKLSLDLLSKSPGPR